MELMACSLCGTEYDVRRRSCPRCGEARGAVTPPPAAGRGGARGRAGTLTVLVALAAGVVMIVVALPKRMPVVAPGRAAPARVDRAASAPDTLLPVVDPESIPPAERAFLDEVAVGQIAFNEGRFEDALTEFAKAFQQDPENAHAANAAGQTLVRLGRSADAIAYLESASALAPSRHDFRFNLARALGQAGRWDEAAAEYRRAAELRPEHYPTVFNLGQALEQRGDADAALAAYQHGAELAPLEPAFKLAAATLAERLGRTGDSRKAFEEYLELVPEGGESDRVRQRLAMLTAPDSAADPAPTVSAQR